ncbi:MAG: hypothetical protein KBS55_03395 [Bacteroidales bacterium]|nr:hypothetical protein [Candidatus Cryptobacteroides aphodequi]
MVKDLIHLETLNMEELTGVVSIYPWFAQARMELCRRMAALGDGGWSEQRFADEAMYLGSRKLLYHLLHSEAQNEAIAESMKTYLERNSASDGKPQVIVAGGDFFSQEDYAGEREASDDALLASIKAAGTLDEKLEKTDPDTFTDFCTETLAQVYANQGYTDMAKHIYSQLSLRYPEKSVYFAALIEKIENKQI